MEATVNQGATRDSSGSFIGVVFATAAIAASVGYVIGANSPSATEEMDTTERYLSGGNRDRILASLAEYERGDFVQHDLIEA